MFTWALVGAPNSGKTTLYNWLTGAKSKTVNYPGSTVEYSMGFLRTQLASNANEKINIVDTPGVYSLNPQTEDEKVTWDVLFNTNKIEKISGVVAVLDATQLVRHLVLAKQIADSGYPVIFVLTMKDLIEKEKSVINLELLKKEIGNNIILFDGSLGGGLTELVTMLESNNNTKDVCITVPNWNLKQQEQAISWSEELITKIIVKDKLVKPIGSFTNKLDEYLMHPIFGFILFFVMMTLLFSAVYWAAQPAMDSIDGLFAKLADAAKELAPGLVGEFLGSGLVAAIGGVVIFVPQIFILFLGIGLLEATGYLARVAALIDKPLTMVGLGGRSFVPLLSGFACAIPAIMAARNITSKKEKLIAQSIIPFMTCSARLPVYALLIGFLYADANPLLAGFTLSLLYFGGILVGAIAANIISLFLNDTTKSRLLMELPLYRKPKLKIILMQALNKSKNFVLKAGPIILCLALVLWFATNFPRPELVAGQEISASDIAKDSYAAKVGQFVEPVFKPMGVDWRVGFGIISAFAAREVFVSSLALMFNIEGDEETQTEGLLLAMRSAKFPDGSSIFTTASVVGILIFFMIALQCTSTVGIMRREMGSWKPALMQLFLSNIVAYCLAVVVVYGLKSLGY